METYKIEIDNLEYCVTLKQDKTFLIENDEADVYVLSHELNGNAVKWTLIKGQASEELIEALGSAIEPLINNTL
jgi:hypothetical protein